MNTQQHLAAYFSPLEKLLQNVSVTDAAGETVECGKAVDWVQEKATSAHANGNKIMFVGNGGSAGIASHCAIDYSKNGDLRSLAFNDPAALTCLANDLGFEKVFSKQVDLHARGGDLMFAISSSGNSINIRNGVTMAKEKRCDVVTLSGFKPDNPLRQSGDMNFYVGSMEYGFVEIAHLTICHAILDLKMGWTG